MELSLQEAQVGLEQWTGIGEERTKKEHISWSSYPGGQVGRGGLPAGARDGEEVGLTRTEEISLEWIGSGGQSNTSHSGYPSEPTVWLCKTTEAQRLWFRCLE